MIHEGETRNISSGLDEQGIDPDPPTYRGGYFY